MSINLLNKNADVLRAYPSLLASINASSALSTLLKPCLGPKGQCKMMVDGGGGCKVTQDGNVILSEMRLQHPIAQIIARCSTAQEQTSGDGTISVVILVGDILKACEKPILEGVLRHSISDGIQRALDGLLSLTDSMKRTVAAPLEEDYLLYRICYQSLQTKLDPEVALEISPHVLRAFRVVAEASQHTGRKLDLHMVEIMHLKGLTMETRFVRGIVFDHGPRHPFMPTELSNCHVLCINVSLEYEKTEINSGFYYSSVEEKEKLVNSERSYVDENVAKIIRLKRRICNSSENLVVFNMKGIDPASLDALAKENILALRRIKRRNLERITLCCGGNPLNSLEDELEVEDCGYCKSVVVKSQGEEKYTFLEGVKDPKACSIFIQAPSDHEMNRIKDAIRSTLMSLEKVCNECLLLPGGGAFEIKAHQTLMHLYMSTADSSRHGIQAVAEGLLSVPKVLASNSGYDQNTVLTHLMDRNKNGKLAAVNVNTGCADDPEDLQIYDMYSTKRQIIMTALPLVQQLILIDEVIRAGKSISG